MGVPDDHRLGQFDLDGAQGDQLDRHVRNVGDPDPACRGTRHPVVRHPVAVRPSGTVHRTGERKVEAWASDGRTTGAVHGRRTAVLLALGTAVPTVPVAGAASSPYTVAIAGCFEQPGADPTIGEYIEVQAYGLPAAAYDISSNGVPNTGFQVWSGSPSQPVGRLARRTRQRRAIGYCGLPRRERHGERPGRLRGPAPGSLRSDCPWCR